MVLKTVNLHEANGLLPYVRESFLHINLLLAYLAEKRSQNHEQTKNRYALKKTGQKILVIKKSSAKSKMSSLSKDINSIEVALLNELSELMRLGVVIKSIFPPHIDFLSHKNNEPIYLCWHGNEQEICHWHGLDDNQKNRHKIKKRNLFGGPEVVH